jgi:hypothetical protein
MALTNLFNSSLAGVARGLPGRIDVSDPIRESLMTPVTTVGEPVAPAGPAAVTVPGDLTVRPIAVNPVMTLPVRFPPIVLRPPVPQPHVATDLARRAVDQLRGTGENVVNDAIAAAHNAGLPPASLMAFLARKVLIGEVLGSPAAGWSDETRRDFAGALNIAVDRQDVMDAVVSLAVLNDPDLEQEMRGEHMTPASEADLLGSRRVVWQHPPPGTPLQPPYVVLIAVEHEQVAEAQEAVDAILGELTTLSGFRVPRRPVPPPSRPDATGPIRVNRPSLLAERPVSSPIQ